MLLRGAWVSRAPLGILIFGRGHRWNVAVVPIAMVWSIFVIQEGFFPVSGFPPVGL